MKYVRVVTLMYRMNVRGAARTGEIEEKTIMYGPCGFVFGAPLAFDANSATHARGNTTFMVYPGYQYPLSPAPERICIGFENRFTFFSTLQCFF